MIHLDAVSTDEAAEDAKALRVGYIVSIPIDLSGQGDEELAVLEEKGVKGRYVSVERVMELENGDTEWRMATSSTPGGSIPNFIVESTMAKKISSVCCFVDGHNSAWKLTSESFRMYPNFSNGLNRRSEVLRRRFLGCPFLSAM